MKHRCHLYRQWKHVFPEISIQNFLEFCYENQLDLQPIEKENKNSSLFYLTFPDRFRLFLKKIPMIPEDFLSLTNKNQVQKQVLLTQHQPSIWREVYIHRLCNQMLIEEITPHFPFFYGHHFSFDDLNSDNYSCPNLFLIMEKMDTDLKTWVLKKANPEKQWMDLFFQLFFAVYGLQKYLHIQHRDLHWGNVLLKELDPPQRWSYKIDQTYVTLQDQTFLLSICDFGHAIFRTDLFQGNENSLKDYKRIVLNVHRWSKMIDPPPPEVEAFLQDIRNSPATSMQEIFLAVIKPRLLNIQPASRTCFDFDKDFHPILYREPTMSPSLFQEEQISSIE